MTRETLRKTSGMITRKRRNNAGLGQVEYLPSFNILSVYGR